MLNTIKSTLFGERYAKIKFRLAMVLFFCVVFFGSLPGMRKDVSHLASGLVLHSLTYMGLALLLFRSKVSQDFRLDDVKAVLLVSLMGAIDETVQIFVPYRTATVTDWLLDTVAGLLMILLLKHQYYARKKGANSEA